MKPTLLILLTAFSLAHAEEGVLTLNVPPGPGDRFQRAEFACWLPEAATIKAVIVHQHGCPAASPEKHPPVTGDWHWQALARKHHAALLVPMYSVTKDCDEWNEPNGGSERALFAALDDFSRRSGHPELKEAPWLLWGHSGGSSWSAQMIVRHPGRVLAASFRGGCHKQFGAAEFREKFIAATRAVPLLFVWGKRESAPPSSHYVSWVPMNTMFRELREHGAHVTRVIDPRSEHGCDDSRLMSIPFFDAVLSGATKPGALVEIDSRQDRDLTEADLHDPALTWAPNAKFAALWREFSETGTLRPTSPPSQAPELRAATQPDGAVQLTWRVIPELAGGLRALRFQRDGQPWKELAVQPADYLATSRDATPERLRATSLGDDSRTPHVYTLRFVDAAGHESPASKPVSAPEH